MDVVEGVDCDGCEHTALQLPVFRLAATGRVYCSQACLERIANLRPPYTLHAPDKFGVREVQPGVGVWQDEPGPG